jgi:hypothetical protein
MTTDLSNIDNHYVRHIFDTTRLEQYIYISP